MVKGETKTNRLGRYLPFILIIGGAIGLFCSVVLVHDELQLLKNPAFQPSCNINPVIACGSVMKSSQAHILGYLPNPAVGLIAFPVLITVGAA
ncbi:MAG: vitamin K epoxide reductase family protein, partial [Candidatus Saccharimonadales bacterium]